MALSKMLDASLFQTLQFKEMMEDKARNNMRNELGGL
jgi:predicted metal-dependent HD superfamily phosphohydrolase